MNTADGFVMFQSGNFAGDIEIEWLKVTHKEAPSISLWNNMLLNSDCESDDTSCFYATEMTSGPKAATFGAAGAVLMELDVLLLLNQEIIRQILGILNSL